MTQTNTVVDSSAPTISTVWWWILIRGVFAIIFGIIALIAPLVTLMAMAIVFGVYAIVDGITLASYAIGVRRPDKTNWGWLAVQGVVSVLAGIAALVLPGFAGALGGLVVLWTIVIWSIVSGILALPAAIRVEAWPGKNLAIAGAVVSIIFGVFLAIAVLLNPAATLIGLVWTVGIYAIILGVLIVAMSIHIRRMKGPRANLAA